MLLKQAFGNERDYASSSMIVMGGQSQKRKLSEFKGFFLGGGGLGFFPVRLQAGGLKGTRSSH